MFSRSNLLGKKFNRAWIVYAILPIILATTAKAQSVYYVDANVKTPGNGTSWTMAFQYLQEALDAATAGAGDLILVAGGTYKPDEPDPRLPLDRNETFTLKDKLFVFGGYAGSALPMTPNTRDISLYESILTGNLRGELVEWADTNPPDGVLQPREYILTARNDNSYHVVTVPKTAPGKYHLDGFSVQSGHAADPLPTDPNGAGISCEPMQPGLYRLHLRNCTFKYNLATRGGAVFFDTLTSWTRQPPWPLTHVCLT